MAGNSTERRNRRHLIGSPRPPRCRAMDGPDGTSPWAGRRCDVSARARAPGFREGGEWCDNYQFFRHIHGQPLDIRRIMMPLTRSVTFALALAAALCGSAITSAQPAPGAAPAPTAAARAAASRRSVAARRRPHQRAGARLPAAGQQVGRQPDRLPRGARDQAHRREGRDLRRDLRHRAHAGRQGRAHGRLRGHADQQDRLSHAAEPRRGLRARAAEGVRGQGPHDLARPAAVVARARRRQAAHRAGAEQSAAGDRQLLAGDPGADRRRAGDQAGARATRASSASSTRAR